MPWLLCVSSSTRVGLCTELFVGAPFVRSTYHISNISLSCVWLFMCAHFAPFVGFLCAFLVPFMPEFSTCRSEVRCLRGTVRKCQACLPVTVRLILTVIQNYVLDGTWTLSTIWLFWHYTVSYAKSVASKTCKMSLGNAHSGGLHVLIDQIAAVKLNAEFCHGEQWELRGSVFVPKLVNI